MRLILLIYSMFLMSAPIWGQTSFNRSYVLQESPLTFNTINITTQGYVVTGMYIDTAADYLGMCVAKLDYSGEVLLQQGFGSLDQQFNNIGHSMSYRDEVFLHQSTASRNDTMLSRISWISSVCDTLFTKDYMSHHIWLPYENNENITTVYCTLNPDSTVYLANVVVGETTWNDAALQKLDKDGNTLWIYDHATMSDPDKILGIVPREDGVIYTVIESGYNTTPTNHAIVKLNNEGEFQWRIDSEDFLPGTQLLGTTVLDENSIVVSGSYEEPGLQDVYSIACIYKVDTLGNLAWFTTYGEYSNQAYRDFTNIVQTTDSNYVAAGNWKTLPGSEEIPEGYTAVDYDEFAYVVKFDREDGSIIWDRKYRWLEVYRDNHTLRDMKATPDGGVIFCGEVKDFYMQQFEDFQQRGWVVKLDECGCLVPGCDTTCTDIGVREQSGVLPLLLSPNPASDILNVHVGGYSLSKDAALQIIDLSGRIVSTHRIPANNTTYMMRVDELPAGNYVVRLMNDGRVAATGTVVVM
jgi:hypothetical protein